MLIDRIYAPVTTLGPGTRIALWSVGCSKRCRGCANPELWRADLSKRIDDDRLASAIEAMARKSGVRRVTFSGGDPFEQPESLARVLGLIRPHFDDILVYTGYTLDELVEYSEGGRDRLPGVSRQTSVPPKNRTASEFDAIPESDDTARECIRIALGKIDALIDGPYVESLNDGACPMRGSSNQRIHLFNENLAEDYRNALAEPRRVQNVRFGDTCMSIGIHGTANPSLDSASSSPS